MREGARGLGWSRPDPVSGCTAKSTTYSLCLRPSLGSATMAPPLALGPAQMSPPGKGPSRKGVQHDEEGWGNVTALLSITDARMGTLGTEG